MKIVGVHFSYNKNLEQNKNFCKHFIKIENILKLCRMRQLTLKVRITVFKSLAVSKVTYLLLITKLHNNTIDLLYKIFYFVFFKYFIEKLYLVRKKDKS